MRKAAWAGAILGTALLLFLGSMAGIVAREVSLPRARPRPLPPGFRIGVLGDSQKGLANLRNVTRAVLAEKVALLLHTGDLVASNDEGHYRLALKYLKDGGAEEVPWVAPGNHDVKGGTDRFRRYCGDLENSFTQGGVAFVLLDNALGVPPDPRHVEERIDAAGPHERVVLAMHQPPFDLSGQAKSEYTGFLDWLARSHVSYLMCGHAHGYLRKKVGETTVIVNGVGGDYDAWQFDQKVYGTVLEWKDSELSDRVVELDPVHEVWENVEHLALGHLAEAYRRRPILCWVGTLALALAVGQGWFLLARGREKRVGAEPFPGDAGLRG